MFEYKTRSELETMTRAELVQYLYEMLIQLPPEERQEIINEYPTTVNNNETTLYLPREYLP